LPPTTRATASRRGGNAGTVSKTQAEDRTRGLPHRQRECDTQPMLRLDDEWVWDACAADDAEGFLVAR
jgi:hypothetical protein